jgi:glycosyltransferase involved in cell wall biosynthesis
MIYLFIHQNFPAQYRYLARHFADQPGNTVYFITQPNTNRMQGVHTLVYRPDGVTPAGMHPFTSEIDAGIRNGLAVAEKCKELRQQGIRPDIVIGHNGWGETLFVKDVFPDVPLLSYFEFFYHFRGVDIGFDPEFPGSVTPEHLRTRNALNLIGFDAADWGHSPTYWQRSLYPPPMQHRISVVHEGVDTDRVRPDPGAWLRIGDTIFTRDSEVITYVSRNLEPYRGFHSFMRALPEIQRRRPQCHAVIVGGDGASYSPASPETSYRETMLAELAGKLDLSRIHFLGAVPYEVYLNLLQVSSAHIYLTYPFVLSWSFIEAMAAGCLVIGSETPPVLEVLQDRVNGLAVDFFDYQGIAERVDEIFDHPDEMQELRDAARDAAFRGFDLKRRQLPAWESLVEDVVAGRRPPLDINHKTNVSSS